MLKAVTKKRAYEDIVDQIRGLIEKGKIKRGDQLPPEKELGETFKVSRSTVREAVLTLERMMLVERRQGDGTYVTSSSEEAVIQPLAAALVHEKDDLADYFELRGILEPEIAAQAARHSTRRAVGRLEEIVERQAAELGSAEDSVAADSEFHFALAKMSKNPVLERLLFALVRLLRKTRGEYLQTDERKLTSVDGHRAILAAIKGGDPDAAKEAMRQHLKAVEKSVFGKGRSRLG